MKPEFLDNNQTEQALDMNRRHFFSKLSLGLGGVALGSLLGPMDALGRSPMGAGGGILSQPHFTPKVRRVIYLHQSGAPSQLDLFDYKPLLNEREGQDLPASHPRRATAHGHDCLPEGFSPGGFTLCFPAVRQVGQLAE
jgi:hypothetical protein